MASAGGDFPQAKTADFNDNDWKQITLPHAFNEDEAFKLPISQHTDTVMWYRKHFRVKELRGKKYLSNSREFARVVNSS